MNRLIEIIQEEIDKMSTINLQSYYQQHANNKEWLSVLSKFPEELQREIIVERPNGDIDDIKEINNYELIGDQPKTYYITDILNNNLDSLTRIPQNVLDIINKKWNINVNTVNIYDQNPDRYLEYAKMNSNTAKPSVMFDGFIGWGVGRFIAALIRDDKIIKVWDLRSK